MKQAAPLSLALLLMAGIACGQSNVRQRTDQFFRQHDANRDGTLSKDEFPERQRRLFSRIDVNKDGVISKDEDTAFRSRRPGQGRQSQTARDPEGTTILRDVVYARPDGSEQMLDIYLPPNPAQKPLPVSVWIHGGGWQGGSKGNGGRVRSMLHDGFAVVDINYRLSGEAKFPAQVQDCKGAIRWIRAHAGKYHFDPERIGVSGASAGGHLASFLGTTGSTREFDVGDHLDYSSAVQAVCNWFGPSDILLMDEQAVPGSMLKHNSANSPEAKLVGGQITQEPYRSLARKVNPIIYITGDEPPFLHLHGDSDKVVPSGQSELLHAALRKAGVESTLHIVKGGGHGLQNGTGQDDRARIDKMASDFLKKHLSAAGDQ